MTQYEASIFPRFADSNDPKVTHLRLIIVELEHIPSQDTPVRSITDILEMELGLFSVDSMARHFTNWMGSEKYHDQWVFDAPWTMPPFKNGASPLAKFKKLIQWIIDHPHTPPKPLTFEQFQATRRFEPKWDAGGIQQAAPTLVYHDDFYIEFLTSAVARALEGGSQYYLTIENECYENDDLETLERILYQFYYDCQPKV